MDRHTWWASKFLQSQKFLSGSLAWSSTSLHIKHSDVSAEEEDETEGYQPFSQCIEDSRPPLVKKLWIKNQLWLWNFLKMFPHKLQFISRLIFLLQRSTPPPPIIGFPVEGFSKITCNTLTNPDRTVNTNRAERERARIFFNTHLNCWFYVVCCFWWRLNCRVVTKSPGGLSWNFFGLFLINWNQSRKYMNVSRLGKEIIQ